VQLTGAAAVASFAHDVLGAQDDAVAVAIVSTAATARAAGKVPVAMVGGLAGVEALRKQFVLVLS
jgi:N-acetylmuramic acid 6-phosphate etherase